MKDWPWYGHLVLALILLVLFYFVYYKPKDEELKRIKADRMNIETEVVKLRAKKKQLDKIEREIKILSSTLKELEAIIPQKKEISDILTKMHQLAVNSNLNIVNFAPEGEVPKEFYFEWPIPVEVTGSYHNLAIFFDRLSRFSRLFNVEGFSIRSLGQQSANSTISASFIAKTYIFREPAPKKKKGGKKR